ncbi:MAG: hypothetical protein AMXMBFR7_28740 [Planctomycetota bacterium]
MSKKSRQDLRAIVLKEIKARGLTFNAFACRLAELGSPVGRLSVYNYLRGDSDTAAEHVSWMMLALDLEVRKRKSAPRKRRTSR